MDGMLILLLLLVIVYWLAAIILLIIGLVRLRSRPENAKKSLIASGLMLLVGAGICGALLT